MEQNGVLSAESAALRMDNVSLRRDVEELRVGGYQQQHSHQHGQYNRLEGGGSLGFGEGNLNVVGREIGALKRDTESVKGRMGVLERGYEEVLGEMQGLRRWVGDVGTVKRGEMDEGE